MMRICLVASVPLPPSEGIGYHIFNLANNLIKRGHEVSVITRGGLAPAASEASGHMTVWRVPFAPVYPFHVHLHSIFANQLFSRIEKDFDLIHMHTPLPAVIKTHLPMVTTVHSPMLADTAQTRDFHIRTLALRAFTPVMKMIETDLFKRSKIITAVASWVAEALAAYDLDPDEILITGNGVEESFIKNDQSIERQPYLLYVGRLDVGKGLAEFIEAANIVVRKCPDSKIKFVLVGQGPLLNVLQNLVSQYNLEDHVEFRGYLGPEQRHELIELYRHAAAFVQPSHHEGMSTVLLEAMATSTPAISTAVGGALELIVDGETGMLIPAREPLQLADAILRVLSDPELAARLGQNAHQTIVNGFSWTAITNRYLDCYQQALSK